MKVLVISLLRLGDILMTAPVISGIKRKNPKAEVHLLMNRQFRTLGTLIPGVDQFHYFDRKELQEIIGKADRSYLEAYYRLAELVQQLRDEKFDQVVNLTHNRLSGWVGGLIRCADTRGISFNAKGQVSTGSEWFDYLNEQVSQGSTNSFHYIDLFHYGAGLTDHKRRVELQETEHGRQKAAEILKTTQGRPVVALQPCTSEEKKTLSPQKWREICDLIVQTIPGAEIVVLGAPSEESVVDSICQGSEYKKAICDLEEAFSLLLKSHILITGDTSIKHLATATPIKILEVSIGSSAFHKTGAYSNGSVILQTNVKCAPCSHSLPCHQPSHLCADKMPAELVAMVATSLLRNDEGSLRVVAHEYRDSVSLLKTTINAQGDWAAIPLASRFSTEQIGSWLDRTSFKLLFQRRHERRIGEFGTEGVMLKNLLKSMYPEQSAQEWRSAFGILEKEVQWIEMQFEGLLRNLQTLLARLQDRSALEAYLESLETFVRSSERAHLLRSYGRELSHILSEAEHEGLNFRNIKRLRERLVQGHQRSKIELKLVRGLQSEFSEVT